MRSMSTGAYDYVATCLNELWEGASASAIAGAGGAYAKACPIFVTGTGTDVGKTYVTAQLCRMLQQQAQARGEEVGFYKAAISGAEDIKHSDAGYIKEVAHLRQEESTLTSYLYQEAVSPHLAAAHRGEKIELLRILRDLVAVYSKHQRLVLEGSGGIFCPLSWDLECCTPTARDYVGSKDAESAQALLTRMQRMTAVQQDCFSILDLISGLYASQLGAHVIVVADAALGVINDVVMTLQCLQLRGIRPQHLSVILNYYRAHEAMYEDNWRMIEAIAHIPVIGTVAKDSNELELTSEGYERLQLTPVS